MSENEIEILKSAKHGDEYAINNILLKYKSLVSAIARKYFLLGGDRDDIIQEGMIGLFKAVNSFDESKNISFRSYAWRLIEREIISAIRKENSNKNNMLDSSVRGDVSELVHGDTYPEIDVIGEESCLEIMERITDLLSPMEKRVIDLYLKGYAYMDIASMLDRSPKSIDNALSRIKTKLKFLKEKK